jgi:hypothetical protein
VSPPSKRSDRTTRGMARVGSSPISRNSAVQEIAMTKRLLWLVPVLCAGPALAADEANIPRQGTSSAAQVLSGAMQALPLGKDQVRLSYDVTGLRTGEGDLLNNSTVRCVGSLTVINGVFDDESGSCVYTRPDGDQVFSAYKASGRMGVDAKGNWSLLGGTGKLAGIRGTGQFTRTSFKPVTPGGSISLTKIEGSYQLPGASAAR